MRAMILFAAFLAGLAAGALVLDPAPEQIAGEPPARTDVMR